MSQYDVAQEDHQVGIVIIGRNDPDVDLFLVPKAPVRCIQDTEVKTGGKKNIMGIQCFFNRPGVGL